MSVFTFAFMRKLLLSLLLVPLLCTCDRAPETLFVLHAESGVASANMLQEREDFNIIEYLYYYNGGGVAATDINGDGLADLYFTNNQGPNKYYINEGNFKFRDATETAAVAGAGDWSTGVSVVDVDGNGLMDIYVCNVSGYKGLEGRNELFLQQEDGTFIEAAADFGLDFAGFNTQAYWFDYDLDGDLDLYLLRHSVHNDATYGTAEGRNVPDSLAGDMLIRQDREVDGSPFGLLLKNQEFIDVTASTNLYSSKIGYGLSATVADFNRDGWPDLYVCNDFSENDYYYLNQKDGTFRESVRERTGHTSNFSMGSDVGDFDADGWPDLFSLDMRPWDETILKATMSADQPNVYNLKRELGYYDQLPHNALQWNRGDGHFSEIAELAGVAASDWSWSCLIEDFDHDGKQDIFVANGIVNRPNSLDFLKFISSGLANQASNLEVLANMPSGYVPNRAFRQTGEWAFADVAPAWGLDLNGSSTGAAVADLDQDGDLDLVLNNLNAPASIYENRANNLSTEEKDDDAKSGNSTNRMWIAPQRGMMSQSEGGYDWQPQVVEPEEPWYAVRGSGVVREGRAGSYFDKEPLAIYAAEEQVPMFRFFGEFGGNTFWLEDLGTDTLYYAWSAGEFRKLETSQLAPGVRSRQGTISRMQSQTVYVGGDGFMRTTTKGDSVIMQYSDFGVSGDIQSVSRLAPGAVTNKLIFGRLGLNTVLGRATPDKPIRLYLDDFDGNGKLDPIFTYVRSDQEMTVADKDELTGQLPSLRRNNLNYAEFAQRTAAENIPFNGVVPIVNEGLEHVTLAVTDENEYTVDTLPRETQITSLNCVLKIPQGTLLGGNKLEVLPRIGRQDAAALQLLRDDGAIEFVDLGGERNRLEIRQLIRLDESHILVVVTEGEHLILDWGSRDTGRPTTPSE